MSKATSVVWSGVVVAALGLGTLLPAGQVMAQQPQDVVNSLPQSSEAQAAYPGITSPSARRELNFNYPGVVRKVNVKEGEPVKAGDLLLVEDQRIDQKALESAIAEASSAATKIEYQKAELEQKKLVLERKSRNTEERVFSTQEVEEARLDVTLSETRLQLAYDEAKQKNVAVEQQKVKLDLLGLTSTIDGIVEKIQVREGEVADPGNGNKPPIIVVQNDPLKVEVKLPTLVATKLKVGQTLEVRYPDRDQWLRAKITYFSPVADARSGMRMAHLELPNPSQRESGWQVQVRIPDGLIAQAEAPQANR